MKYETLEMLSCCNSECEARMKCDLLGERFDSEQYSTMMNLEPWERRLWLYNIDCNERGVKNVLR